MACSCTGEPSGACYCDPLRCSQAWRRSATFGDMPSNSMNYKPAPKRITVTRALENLYEKCAAYNLRYCPFRSIKNSKSSVKSTLKDCFVLCCFLVANFVVFLTIVTKLAVHTFDAIVQSTVWIKSTILEHNTTVSKCRECSLPHQVNY